MKILAVDDERDILEVLRLILRGYGYPDVTTASSAKDAIRLITTASEPFDCFLIDIQMPEINGIELCSWIRKIPKHRATPILIVTAMIDKSYVDRAFVAGAFDYVTKPIDLTELATRMRTAEQMVDANKMANDPVLVTQDPRVHPEESRKFALSDAIPLNEVAGLINPRALENYLLQLSRGNMSATSVIALRIAKIGEIYARCSPSRFQDILSQVAETALTALIGSNCVLAHTGNGTFVGVVSNDQILPAEEFELIINGILSALQVQDDHGRPLDVQVALGDPRPLGPTQSGTGAVTMLHRAGADLVWVQPRASASREPALDGNRGLLKTLFGRSG